MHKNTELHTFFIHSSHDCLHLAEKIPKFLILLYFESPTSREETNRKKKSRKRKFWVRKFEPLICSSKS